MIATSEQKSTEAPKINENKDGTVTSDLTSEANDPHQMHPTRYERTSELIKAFKHSCLRSREEFKCLDMELPEYSAVLDELTKNTYVMVIVHDPTIGGLT